MTCRSFINYDRPKITSHIQTRDHKFIIHITMNTSIDSKIIDAAPLLLNLPSNEKLITKNVRNFTKQVVGVETTRFSRRNTINEVITKQSLINLARGNNRLKKALIFLVATNEKHRVRIISEYFPKYLSRCKTRLKLKTRKLETKFKARLVRWVRSIINDNKSPNLVNKRRLKSVAPRSKQIKDKQALSFARRSDSDLPDVLEHAHCVPYNYAGNQINVDKLLDAGLALGVNDPANFIEMRRDVHALWDVHKIMMIQKNTKVYFIPNCTQRLSVIEHSALLNKYSQYLHVPLDVHSKFQQFLTFAIRENLRPSPCNCSSCQDEIAKCC